MSVLCNDFAWFRKRNDRVFRNNSKFWQPCETISDVLPDQDRNQAHINIHAVKLMF